MADIIEEFALGAIEGAQSALEDFILNASKDSISLFSSGLDLMASGLGILADDIHDFGKMDHFHHWLLGLILALLGLAIIVGVIIYEWLRS